MQNSLIELNKFTNQVIDVGSKVSRPADPTKYGYNFINWYSNSELNNLFDFDSVIGSSVTLYAKWEPIIYEVTEGNGSEVEREN